MTTPSNDIQTFTLGALRAAGVHVNAVEDGKAYQATVTQPDLRRILQRSTLHFTFDEEYFDIHRDANVEYVAPGYPLLDALIRMTQARFTVSEAVVPHQNVTVQLVQGGVLPLELERHGRYRPMLRFRIRVTYKSDSYEEEIIAVTVDAETSQTLPASSVNWPLHPVTDNGSGLIQTPSESVVLKAWGVVENEIQTIVADKIARQEDLANRRLHHELSKLQQYLQAQHILNSPQGQRQQQELKDRYGLTVKLDLIFAELIHYPVEVVTGRFARQHPRTHQTWSGSIQFELDRVTGRTERQPTCPVCASPLSTLAPCDAGAHVVCPLCSAQCATCGTAHCADHALAQCDVSGCGSGHCPECLKACARCAHAMCGPSCTVACPDCRREVCRDCTVRCADCAHEACEDHFQRCHVTQAPLCATHAATCDRCALPTRSANLHALTRTQGQQVTLCDSCGERCAVSGQLFHPDDLIQCHHTKRRVDPALVAVCSGCHHPVARDVLVQTAAGQGACPSCVDQCGACRTIHLRSELTACSGHHQGAPLLLCSAHQHHCASCTADDVYCSSHLQQCAVGGESVCSSHVSISHLSKRHLCPSHVHRCPDCRQTVATDELVHVHERDGTSRQVCRACTATCQECQPGVNRYARSSLILCKCQSGTPHYVCAAHSVTCHVSQGSYAKSHAVKCQSCAQTTGVNHTKKTGQGKVICTDCVGICPHCPTGTIHALTGLQLCRTCNKPACSQHTHSCSDCGANVCQEHAIRLPDGQYVCTTHARTCAKCKQVAAVSSISTCQSKHAEPLCRSCQKTCPSCQGTHCTDHSQRCRCCGHHYCPSCAGNVCKICASLQPTGMGVTRVRKYLGNIVALGLDLPGGSTSDLKVAIKGTRVHVLYTPPSKGFFASLTRIFSSPPQRLAVLEEKREGVYKLISDREVPNP